jgi:hypothetical protein
LQHGRRSHNSRHSAHTQSSPGSGQLVPYGSNHTAITTGTQLVRHRPHHPDSSLVSRRDRRSPSRSLELHEKASPQSSGVRRASSRRRRMPSPETYQDIRRQQGLPPQSNLNTRREMAEYNNRLEDEKPQCPLIVHQADKIDTRARRYFENTGREMPLSAEESQLVREAPEASDRYYAALETHLVSNGSMSAALAPWRDEVFGSGSEEEADEARRPMGHRRDPHGKRRRRDGR